MASYQFPQNFQIFKYSNSMLIIDIIFYKMVFIKIRRHIFTELYKGSNVSLQFHQSEDCLTDSHAAQATAGEKLHLDRLLNRKRRVFEEALLDTQFWNDAASSLDHVTPDNDVPHDS